VLSSLLTQFRQRYPKGSLTSDLLTLHDGLFVVRVCAGVEGLTLACGLGANPKLETAEDIATGRALERLGLAGVETLESIPPLPKLPVPVPKLTVVPPVVGAIAAPTPQAPGPDREDWVPLEDLPLEEPPPEDGPEDNPSGWPALATPPGAPTPGTPAPEPPGALADDLLALGTGPGTPIDLSDIIAQTDVELQRLGWTVHQGREFLEKTYGKRSRHDLTDDELLEFLLFLETQSSPSSP
jgi:hypothetical protein